MKTIYMILLVSAVCIASCRKNGIPAVNGAINGLPATTLYGATGNATDYVLIVQSSMTANKLLSYNGRTYSYYNGVGNNIYIIISSLDLRRAMLDTVNNKLDLAIDSTGATFLSKDYRER